MQVQKVVLIFDNKKMIRRDTRLIDKIILHHSVCTGRVNYIHRLHQERGFAGIGYHYYVRKDGSIFEGRPVGFVGSHCKGHNQFSIGICFEGDFTRDKPTEEQLKQGFNLVEYLINKYPKVLVYNHRDLKPTLCPGVDLQSSLVLQKVIEYED